MLRLKINQIGRLTGVPAPVSYDADVDGGEHRVERGGELGVAVPVGFQKSA
jgi:hypothetical protein